MDDTTHPGSTSAPQPEPGPGPQPGPEQPPVDWQQVRQVHRLHRPRDRMVAGVCTGLARHFDVDPLVLRVAFGVLAFFGGAGILLYGALWLLLPDEGQERAPVHLDERTRAAVLVCVAVLAAFALVGDSWGLYWFPSWPLAVIAVVVWVLYSRRPPVTGQAGAWSPAATPGAAPAAGTPPPGTPGTSPVPATPPVPPAQPFSAPVGPTTPVGTAAYGWQSGHGGQVYAPQPAPGAPAGATATYAAPPTSAGPGYPAPPLPRDPRRRGPVLFWFTLALVALGLGVLGTVELAGVAVPDSAYPALATATCAVMLLVGAFWGRAGGIIALGLVALLATGGALTTERWDEGSGRVDATPATASELRDHYDLRRGQLRVDLTSVDDLADLDGRRLRLELGAGQIVLVVPDDLAVDLDAEVGGPGSIRLPDGEGRGGIAVSSTTSFGPSDAPRVEVVAELGVGDIQVVQR